MPSGLYRFWYGFFEGCPNRYPDASRIRDCYKRFALGTRLFLKQLQLKRGNLVVETEIFGSNDILHSFPQGGPKKPVASVCNFIYKIHNASYPFVRPFTWGLITPFITIGSGPTSYLFLGIYILEILPPSQYTKRPLHFGITGSQQTFHQSWCMQQLHPEISGPTLDPSRIQTLRFNI